MASGYCPFCGNELTVPEGLTEFSCLYCGKRLVLEQLLTELPDGNCAGDYAEYQRGALHAAVDFPKSVDNLSKPLFFDYFDAYCHAHFSPTGWPEDQFSRPTVQEGGFHLRRCSQYIATPATTRPAATKSLAHCLYVRPTATTVYSTQGYHVWPHTIWLTHYSTTHMPTSKGNLAIGEGAYSTTATTVRRVNLQCLQLS